ncbi:hypothetical protein ACIRBX_15090 [Kitasatospora sp. NPDC096147]|uniref:hypothetical protein n=1 Tax=Kitasatospora sp. NPDC096147 TaxID=3364093 RepID=UPI00382B4B6E
MRMVTALLLHRSRGEATEGEAHLVGELLRSCAVPAYGVERLRVRSAPGGVELVAHVRAEGEPQALVLARALLAAAQVPLLAFGYTVGEVAPLTMAEATAELPSPASVLK